jgi:hypothetical protein
VGKNNSMLIIHQPVGSDHDKFKTGNLCFPSSFNENCCFAFKMYTKSTMSEKEKLTVGAQHSVRQADLPMPHNWCVVSAPFLLPQSLGVSSDCY